MLIRLILLAVLELGLGLFCLWNKKLPQGYRLVGKILLVLGVCTVIFCGLMPVLAGQIIAKCPVRRQKPPPGVDNFRFRDRIIELIKIWP